MVTQKQIDEKTEEFHRAGWDGNHIAQMVANWKRRQEKKELDAIQRPVYQTQIEGNETFAKIVNDKNRICWSSGSKSQRKVGDTFTFIKFLPPQKREIGYLFITAHTIDWIHGLALSTTTKDILTACPKTREEGISLVTEYMEKAGERKEASE